MVKDHLLEKFSESDLGNQSYRIYTTLDPDLQRAATEAVQIGIQNVDKLLAQPVRAVEEAGPAAPPRRRWRWSRSIRIPARFAR